MENGTACNTEEGFLSRMALNDNKAGMEGLDRDKINKIIMETSKGSRFYENELKREQQVNQRIEKMMLQKTKITEEQLKKAQAQVERVTSELERTRNLGRVIVHVDMDAFYAAVEMRDCPELKDKPMAVGSMSMLSTSNYHARKFGVRAAMPGFIAKKLCPDLVIVPTNFDKYRAVSEEIREIFAEYDPHFQSVSLDEAYLDFTDHLEQRKSWPKSSRTHHFCASQTTTGDAQKEVHQNTVEDMRDLSPVLFEDTPTSSPVLPSSGGLAAAGETFEVFGTSVEEAVREMRFRIEQKTRLTASAGIAPNMMLAKVCSDKNKPNGQYRLPSTREAVMDFIQNLPVRKVSGIGKVSEKMLNALGISTCSHLGQQMALLSLLFSETAWTHFIQISLGLGSIYIPRHEERKSMSTERTFKELNRPEEQFALCKTLCEDLAEDMKKEGLKGKTVTLKLKNVNFEVKTRALTVPYAVATPDEIFAAAKDLLKTEIENETPQPLRLRLMGVRVSAFVSSDDKKPLQRSIIGFLQSGKTDCIDSGPSQRIREKLEKDHLPSQPIQTLPLTGLPPVQNCCELPWRTKQGGGKANKEPQQSFFQRAQAKRLQLQAVNSTTQEVEHGERAPVITSTGNHTDKSVETSATVQESNSNTASCVSQKDISPSPEPCASTSGCGGPVTKSLTCPVCFTQIKTADLNVFNKHIDLCLTVSRRKPNQHTYPDSESDLDSENSKSGWEMMDTWKGHIDIKEEETGSVEVNRDDQQQRLEHSDCNQTVINGDSGAVTSKQPQACNDKCPILICPVCHMTQDTTDLTIFNHHVDLCLNQEVLHELRGQTLTSMNPPSVAVTNNKVIASSHLLLRQASKSKTKRRDSPSSPPSKKTKGLTPRNTIDKFFRKLLMALKAMIMKRRLKKGNLDPRTWIRQETMKGFADFVLNKHSDKETDKSFDNKEMLLDAEKQFIEAAKKNDIETMKILGKGLNANAKNVHHRTALHYAVAGKNTEAVQYLLQRRVKVDQRDKYGVTPIHLAAWFGSLEILKLLVQAGAEQKIENEEGLNIMHCAAVNNQREILEYIVNDLQMKELDKDDRSGHSAFALAAEHGCVEMLEMLMEPSYKMATMKPNERGDTPLHLAARNGHLDAVQLLLQSFDTRDEVNMDGETALYQAAENGQEECALTLLEAGCDPNIITTTQCSPLHPVSDRGETSLVQVLLEYEAQTDFQDQNQQTPLHLAVKNSHIPVINALLQAGCNVNTTDKRSQTAMHIAAEVAKAEVVEMLLKTGLDLTLQDRQGKTALDVAARADEVIIVDMIIKAERYYAQIEANPELNESVRSEFPLTFKLDHRYETKQLRSVAWRLAYELLKPGDWKRLAEHWGFTKKQMAAIEEQWTGQHSYQEHGNRMLLIWLHREELAHRNPTKGLFQGLTVTGNTKAADKIRIEAESSNKSCTIS